MAYPLSAGMPTFSGMTIPELYKVDAAIKFYTKTVLPGITSTEYNEDLKNQGDTVNIKLVPTVTGFDYYAGMTLPDNTTSVTRVQLLVDKGWAFNESIDNVIAQQSDVNMVDLLTNAITSQMAVDIDRKVLAGIQTGADSSNSGATAGIKSGTYDLGATGAAIPITYDNALEKLAQLIAVIKERDIDTAGIWVLVPSWFGHKLQFSDLKVANEMGDKTSTARTGLIGKISGVDVLESNNMTSVTDGTDSSTCWYCLAGHQSAIAFASTINEFRVKEPSDIFGKKLQAVNIYGYKVVQDDYLAALYCKPTT